MSLTAKLGSAIAGLSDSPLPADVVHQARRALVNILATSVAGARHEGSDAIVRTALRLDGTGSVPVPGREERLDPYRAALATGFAAHVDDFDDTHLETVIHPGAATLAAAVGAAGYAARAERPVHDSLRAFALAMEVQLRFGRALGPAHYAAGWHTTGTCGVMGATVMAGLALGLPPDHLAGALGVAASCTLGHREGFGSDGKAFHPGKAAVNGLLAAVAGSCGIRSSDMVLEAPRGYFRVLSDDPAPEELLRDFGTRWLLLDLTYKPYPCGIVAHPAIDAAVELHQRSRGQAALAIRVRCHPLVVELMGNPVPETGLQARFSTVHAVACALLDGGFGLAHVTDEAANRPDVARLRSLVSLETDASVGRSEAVVTLETDSGETLTATVQAARGSISAPLTDTDLGRKARSLLELRLAPRAAGDILERAWSATDSTSVTGVAGPSRQADLRPWALTSTPREDAPAGNTGPAGITELLCEFAAGTELADIPADVRHDCARTVANALATGVAAARHPEIARLAAALVELSPDRGGTQLGTGDRLPVLSAALVNGMAIHIQDFDDTHLAADTHVGATVLPAALAAAELTGASGGLLLTGVTVGMEVALRVALGVVPAAFNRGWHVTSIVGRIGAAVAAGRILGLDASQLRSAVGLAATQAGGVQAAFGSTVKSWHAGKAAADGLEAALLAAAGMTGPACPIEGRRGFLALMTAAPHPDRVTAGLGESWECARLSFKPYACGVVAHPAIDAAIALHSALDGALTGQPGAVAEVIAGVNPVVFDVMGITEPVTGLQGKFSVIHCVAAGLLDGYAGPGQFTDTRVRAADAQALRRVTLGRPDSGLAKDAAWVQVRLRDGRELRHDVLHATGSVDNPLTDEDIRMKATRGFGRAGATHAQRLMDLAFGVERLPSVAPFLEAVRIPDNH